MSLASDMACGGVCLCVMYMSSHHNIHAYGEGATEEEAIDDLKQALIGYIEIYGVEDALARMSHPTTLKKTDWTLKDLVQR